VRFADGPTVEVDVHIAAPPSVVWELVTDITVPARFSQELQSVEWLDGATGPAFGARFAGRNRHDAGGSWETVSKVTVLDPQRAFAWAVGDPSHPSATWRFDLSPEGSGTRLRQQVRLGPGPSGLTRVIASMPDKEERIIAGRREEHRRNMTATVQGIKELAEARVGGH
jgi:uncharacterized protein YndB with AHSA1/START domain